MATYFNLQLLLAFLLVSMLLRQTFCSWSRLCGVAGGMKVTQRIRLRFWALMTAAGVVTHITHSPRTLDGGSIPRTKSTIDENARICENVAMEIDAVSFTFCFSVITMVQTARLLHPY